MPIASPPIAALFIDSSCLQSCAAIRLLVPTTACPLLFTDRLDAAQFLGKAQRRNPARRPGRQRAEHSRAEERKPERRPHPPLHLRILQCGEVERAADRTVNQRAERRCPK